jgi:hypothetical protein
MDNNNAVTDDKLEKISETVKTMERTRLEQEAKKKRKRGEREGERHAIAEETIKTEDAEETVKTESTNYHDRGHGFSC